jgi:hypothetical protein
MSHDRSRRDSCFSRIPIRQLHFDFASTARGVTAVGVGSGDLFGLYLLAVFYIDYHHNTRRIINPKAEEKSVNQHM